MRERARGWAGAQKATSGSGVARHQAIVGADVAFVQARRPRRRYFLPMIIKGSFEVRATPEPPYSEHEGVSLGRVSFAKQFHGPLTATSSVDMIAARTPIADSAGYVAIERVTGTLEGHSGSFVLQHSGVMTRGQKQLTVTVVPDSGTGELRPLRGSMAIDIVDGKHFYTFDYELG
jgi:Protein of unknown function (DUF3224)